jgi:hypothetical protein
LVNGPTTAGGLHSESGVGPAQDQLVVQLLKIKARGLGAFWSPPSWRARLPESRVTFRVDYANHFHFLTFKQVEDLVREPPHQRPSGLAVYFGMAEWIFLDLLENDAHFSKEFVA